MAEPANGYLWNLAQQAGITFRNYGEFVISVPGADPDDAPAGYQGSEAVPRDAHQPRLSRLQHGHPGPAAGRHLDRGAGGVRAAAGRCRGSRSCGSLTITPRARRPGRPRPAPTWPTTTWRWAAWSRRCRARRSGSSTAIFVLEDDAQNGPDHVDSHRSPLLVISPWTRGRGAPPLGQHHRRDRHDGGDPRAGLAVAVRLLRRAAARHLARALRTSPVHRAARRPCRWTSATWPGAPGSAESADLDLAFEDRIPDDRFNRILWRAIKGEGVAYPEPERLSAPEWAGVAARSR